MADVLSQLSEDVTCSICHEYFIIPKVLNCLHRFCRDCLHRYIVSSKVVSGPSCPECRQVIKPKISWHTKIHWADDFPTDFLVASMCDRLKAKRDMCLSHPENQVLSYCKDCRRCICHVCAAVDHRRCDEVTSLRLEAQQERARQENYLETLERNQETIESNIKMIKAEKRVLKRNHDQTAKNVKEEFDTARQILDQEERQILTKLNDIMSVQDAALDRAETSEVRTLSSVTDEKQRVSTTLQLKSDVAFMGNGRKPVCVFYISEGIIQGDYASKTNRPVKKAKMDVIRNTLQEMVPDLTEDPCGDTPATRMVKSDECRMKIRVARRVPAISVHTSDIPLPSVGSFPILKH